MTIYETWAMRSVVLALAGLAAGCGGTPADVRADETHRPVSTVVPVTPPDPIPEPAPAPTVPAKVSGEYELATSAYGVAIAAASEASLIDREVRLSALADTFRAGPGRIAVDTGGAAAAHPVELAAGKLSNEILLVRLEERSVEVGELSSGFHAIRPEKGWQDEMASALAHLVQYEVYEVVALSGDASVSRVVEVLDLIHASGVKRVNLVGDFKWRGSMKKVDRAAVSPAMIRLAPPTVTGDLTFEIIHRYVARKLPDVQQCASARAPTTPARFTIEMVIMPNGKVRKIDPTADNRLADCAAAILETIYFPLPRGGGMVTVSLPFVLSE